MHYLDLGKGYGFIKVSGRDETVFFHRRHLADGLAFDRQLVERYVKFRLQRSRYGQFQAVEIEPGE